MCGNGGLMFRTDEREVDRGHHADSEYEALKHELKVMYARGEIDGQTYHRLKHLAKVGELGWDDVRRLRREGTSVPVARECPTNLPSPERSTVTSYLDAGSISQTDWIRQRTEQLREAEEESGALLREVETKAEQLRARLDEMQGNVEVGSTSERVLQSQTERKLALQQQIAALESRARELREDLQRIDSLRSQLALREQETRAAESRRKIAVLEEAIRGERSSNGG